MATKWTIGGDAADPQLLARFWAAALGYVIEPGFDDPSGSGIIDPDGVGPAIGFLRVPEPKTAKNRLHLDIRVAGPGERSAESAVRMRSKAAALVELGATQVHEEFYGDQLGHIVMLDPEGNEFCVG
ncbi:VOC family protein [Kribbella sp. NPDC020789]